jgi:DNA-binding phage protein
MVEKKFERVMRTGKLTREEVARDEEIRRKVQEEFPPAQRSVDAGPHPLSQALRKAIRDSHKSVAQIAQEAGVSPTVIGRFLSGDRDIRMATADKLAGALDLKLQTG